MWHVTPQIHFHSVVGFKETFKGSFDVLWRTQEIVVPITLMSSLWTVITKPEMCFTSMPGDTSYDLLFAQVRKVHIMSPDHPSVFSIVLLEKCAVFLYNTRHFWYFVIRCIDILKVELKWSIVLSHYLYIYLFIYLKKHKSNKIPLKLF